MSKTTPTIGQIKEVKAAGFLHNRGTSQFSGRVITKSGVLSAQQMEILSQAANKFGSGTLTFTVRLTVEIPGIDFDNIAPFRDFIAQGGMLTGGTGAKVRPVVACKGTTCVFGIYNTQALGDEIHERFFVSYSSVALPHKFKITVGGCPNNCAKPDLNDIGIVGQRVMNLDLGACRGCAKCAVVATCPMGAAEIKDKKLLVNRDICNNCGRCTGKCHFKIAENSVDLYKIYIGGRWGKKIRIGTPLSKLFTKSEALDVVEKAILLFKSEGENGERFGQTVDRIGVERADKLLIENQLLNNKSRILAGEKCQ